MIGGNVTTFTADGGPKRKELKATVGQLWTVHWPYARQVLPASRRVSGRSSVSMSAPHSASLEVEGRSWSRYAVRGYIPGGDNLTGSLVLVSITAAFGTIAFFMLLAGIRSSGAGLCAIFTTVRSFS